MEQLKIAIDAFDMPWTQAIADRVDALHEAQPNPCP